MGGGVWNKVKVMPGNGVKMKRNYLLVDKKCSYGLLNRLLCSFSKASSIFH